MKKLLFLLGLFLTAALFDKPEDHIWATIDAQGMVAFEEHYESIPGLPARMSAAAAEPCSITGQRQYSSFRYDYIQDEQGGSALPDNEQVIQAKDRQRI